MLTFIPSFSAIWTVEKQNSAHLETVSLPNGWYNALSGKTFEIPRENLKVFQALFFARFAALFAGEVEYAPVFINALRNSSIVVFFIAVICRSFLFFSDF
jgi:hypothetical protein